MQRKESLRATMQARADAKRPVFKPRWKVSKKGLLIRTTRTAATQNMTCWAFGSGMRYRFEHSNGRLRRYEPNAGYVAEL